jgi:hypothetical protein
MELLCPHCFKRVTIPDDKAGQHVNCPLCSKTFGAPALTSRPAPSPPPPPPVPPEDKLAASSAPPPPAPWSPPPLTPTSAEPPAPLIPISAVPAPAAEEPLPPPPPETRTPAVVLRPEQELPPPPPGDYTRSRVIVLKPEAIGVAGAVCLTLIVLLSFFPWHTAPANLWGLAFAEGGKAVFLAYLLLTVCLAWPLSVAGLLIERRIVRVPPALQPWLPWRALLIAGLLALALVPLGYDYFEQHMYGHNAHAIALKLAARLHLAALVLFLCDFWLLQRSRRHLPLPRAELRW